tara:strand:+ start:10726 stop:11766 length:1041 start_codon:yes stop_codon:yes gene_type:complete
MEQTAFLIAFLLIVIGGIMEGSFSLPLRYASKWEWENIWGAGSLMALVLIPWPLAFLTIPNLIEVYAGTSFLSILLALLFGIGWGVGGIYFGKGLDALGMAFGYTLIMSLAAAGGSLLPLLINNPSQVLELAGIVLLGGILIMIIGLSVTARAGKLKDRELAVVGATKESKVRVPFSRGMLYCILAGLFSALVNFGFIYGSEISVEAEKFGASKANASNAIWALVFTMNFLVNTIYCLYLSVKNKTFSNFRKKGTGKYWFWALFMGLLWPGGIVVYGMGAVKIGALGPIFGFPVMIICSIIAGNLWGIFNKEWLGTTKKPRKVMMFGVAILAIAVFVIGFSNKLVA